MNAVTRMLRTWRHSRKFAKLGKHCRFPGKYLHVDGHVEMGDHCRFRDNVILRTHGDGKIVFGNRSGASFYCIFEATSLIQIGSFTAIAEFTVIRDTDHLVYGTTEHWRYTPQIAKPIIIGDNCLIGSRVYIGPGVTIGEGAVIAPGSVVTRDVGPYEIWAGYPARKVAHRTENIPESRMRQYRDLIAQYGLKEDRHVSE